MTERRQLRVWPSPALDEVLRAGGPQETATQRLHTVAERYLGLIEACAPLTENERVAVFETLGSVWPASEYWWAAVQKRPGVATKHGVDPESLVAKLQALTPAEYIALEELADRWDQEAA